MIFTPKPAAFFDEKHDELARRFGHRALLRGGLYDFEVVRASETATRRGGAALRLTLRLHDPADDGLGYNGGGKSDHLVDDCLTAGDLEHLWQFTRTVGLEDCYGLGSLDAAQALGQSGTCKIGIEPGRPDGRGGRHPDRNRVLFYVCDPAQVGIYF